jgi:hypothetical protein
MPQCGRNSRPSLGLEALMMHLTAATPCPRRRPSGIQPTAHRSPASCRRRSRTQYRALRSAHLVFRSADANLLEFAAAAFHYSVIGLVGVARRAAGSSLHGHRLPATHGAVAPGAVAQGNDGWCPKPGKPVPAPNRQQEVLMRKTLRTTA